MRFAPVSAAKVPRTARSSAEWHVSGTGPGSPAPAARPRSLASPPQRASPGVKQTAWQTTPSPTSSDSSPAVRPRGRAAGRRRDARRSARPSPRTCRRRPARPPARRAHPPARRRAARAPPTPRRPRTGRCRGRRRRRSGRASTASGASSGRTGASAARSTPEQLLDRPLGLGVGTLAEVVLVEHAVGTEQVAGRPAEVVVLLPDLERGVDEHGILDPEARDGVLDRARRRSPARSRPSARRSRPGRPRGSARARR